MLLSHFSRVRLCATPQMAATRLPRPWDSPGKATGVGCHFLLQCMKVKSESEVAQSCPTLSNPMDCSLPGSSVHGILQARVLEWGAIAFSVNQLQDSTIVPQISPNLLMKATPKFHVSLIILGELFGFLITSLQDLLQCYSVTSSKPEGSPNK